MKFLIESHNYIGDIMLDVPIFHAIASRGHQLEVILGDRHASILEDCEFINAVHVKRKSLIAKAVTFWFATRTDWDVILVTRYNPRHYPRYKPLRLLGRTRMFRDSSYMHDCMFGKGAIPYRLSILDGIIDCWKDAINTTLPIKQFRYDRALQLAGMSPRDRYLTVAPGASKPVKQWSLRNFANVIDRVQNFYDHVLIVGSHKEGSLCSALAETAPSARNLAGELDLLETCALVSSASQHLGNDSGLGHVAAGNGVPVVAVGGDGDGHFVPWKQQMLPGLNSEIVPDQVVAAITEKNKGEVSA